jgi:hypothetical protein
MSLFQHAKQLMRISMWKLQDMWGMEYEENY